MAGLVLQSAMKVAKVAMSCGQPWRYGWPWNYGWPCTKVGLGAMAGLELWSAMKLGVHMHGRFAPML